VAWQPESSPQTSRTGLKDPRRPLCLVVRPCIATALGAAIVLGSETRLVGDVSATRALVEIEPGCRLQNSRGALACTPPPSPSRSSPKDRAYRRRPSSPPNLSLIATGAHYLRAALYYYLGYLGRQVLARPLHLPSPQRQKPAKEKQARQAIALALALAHAPTHLHTQYVVVHVCPKKKKRMAAWRRRRESPSSALASRVAWQWRGAPGGGNMEMWQAHAISSPIPSRRPRRAVPRKNGGHVGIWGCPLACSLSVRFSWGIFACSTKEIPPCRGRRSVDLSLSGAFGSDREFGAVGVRGAGRRR
jgi:hypothetical protein